MRNLTQVLALLVLFLLLMASVAASPVGVCWPAYETPVGDVTILGFYVVVFVLMEGIPFLFAGILGYRDRDNWKRYVKEAVLAAGIYPVMLIALIVFGLIIGSSIFQPLELLVGLFAISGPIIGFLAGLFAGVLVYRHRKTMKGKHLGLIYLNVFVIMVALIGVFLVPALLGTAFTDAGCFSESPLWSLHF